MYFDRFAFVDDHRPRNAFGYLLGFGKAYAKHYTMLDRMKRRELKRDALALHRMRGLSRRALQMELLTFIGDTRRVNGIDFVYHALWATYREIDNYERTAQIETARSICDRPESY